jgi:hypothetical protein
MDRISAPPQNALLGRLAELLRTAEMGAASGPEFLPKGLDVMNLVRQLALPSAETVEKLSYGDPLFRMAPSGTGSLIPMTTDKQYLADVAGMMPLGAPAARPTARGMQDIVRQIQTEPPIGTIGSQPKIEDIPSIFTRPEQEPIYAKNFTTKETDGILEVTPTSSPGFGQQVFGEGSATGLYPGTAPATRGLGQSVYGVSEQEANRQVQSLLKQPDTNRAFQIANQFTTQNLNQPYQLGFNLPASSLTKQSGIGRTYEIAAEFGDKYPKQTVFEGYLSDPEYGPIIQSLGIKNYDDLLERSYKQLEQETTQQFNALPVRMSYHNGELNYLDSNEMLRDIVGHNHLTVYRGGDRHEFLNKVDPGTGLNSNEQFRAVHDYFGHAIRGNPFGAKGEEIAWASHQQMFSPLARIAMTAETRGQNSFVNYTPINAELVDRMESIRRIQNEARRNGNENLAQEASEELRRLGGEWGYAKQASIVLPVEFTKVNFRGGMPDYLSGLVEPKFGTSETLTHFGKSPSMSLLDPGFYGTGIKGAELRRIEETEQAIRPRSYAYRGEPGQVQPEPGLGPYVYQTQGQNLYDITPDPEKLALLARVRNTGSYLTPYGGILDQAQMLTDLERLTKQYGYSGLLDPQKAVLFSPQPVTRIR